ncbi:dTDP-4-amino-4,6-dideoxygalactose transaminase [uncultured Oscillibacter sp.]|uniref:dTDP-4-amino-4,6-dideoxygalactose transaminase n=1 Tax=uncultured Oscillibacter sp. TaxID=876091 RepID=UPI0025F700AD|nr:dTDP-4-amino-4,6-dideoxygalactose transaminase [uncultured Oscillibacter sp.]
MIPFNRPPVAEKSFAYMRQAAQEQNKICGDGMFTKKCCAWMEKRFQARKILLTTSCTHALELAALLCDIQPGDEVIMPSYTFVSTANAFALRGAKIVFVDIRPDTMNIDEQLIEAAITPKTKVIVPVHYAGVACEMDAVMEIARRNHLLVVEDAAQGVMSSYKGKALGTIGDLGCYSFHETKNYSMGEGGALAVNRPELAERAEILREKGTNRSRFLRGQVDKYTWVDIGSSYLPSELNAAYLCGQLEIADEINENRLKSWNAYREALLPLRDRGLIDLPIVPDECRHNAHMFYIKVRDIEQRTELIRFLKEREIGSAFHYVPLHSSAAGLARGIFSGADHYTTRESERLLRLPMFFGLWEDAPEKVSRTVEEFFL